MKDLPLLWKVYDHIAAHPEEWYQGMWVKRRITPESTSCGTTFCFAGHAVMMAHPTVEPMWLPNDDTTGQVVMDDGTRYAIDSLACETLGLNETEGHQLFKATNTLPAIHDLLMTWESEARV